MNTLPKNLKILLVEDEQIALIINRTLLKKMGYTVDTAITGEEAVQKASNDYDVIFMDIGLPDISGIEATKQILKNKNDIQKKTKIIALTAYTQKEIHNQCFEVGMTDVILKPAEEAQIKKVLESI